MSRSSRRRPRGGRRCLHPQTPLPAVRDAIYGGFDEAVNNALATHGLGWHYETGLQILRIVLRGVFDRHPDPQVITGHWGEVVLFYLDRIEMRHTSKIRQPVSDYFRTNVSVTSSGVWSQRYLRWAIEVLGINRIMFSTDYPYRFTPNGGARRFLEEADLSLSDKTAVASGNWERLITGIRR
jgi:predicted TIM-barrel fold metal-dependent hydrolase